MSLLYPLMLAGLAGLAVPVIIHLIARRRFPIRDFPSIQLLQPDVRSNIFAPRLVDVPQLLLRLLVLALLALAMSRVFLPGLSSRTPPRNLVVVVDCSASMKMLTPTVTEGKRLRLIDIARQNAREMIAQVGQSGRVALVIAGDDARVLTPFQPGSDEALAAVDTIEASDGGGSGLVSAVALACDMLSGRHEVRSQIVVLTDLRASAFETRNRRDLVRIQNAHRTLGRALDIAVYDFSAGAARNMAIVDAYIRGRNVQAGDDAHVIARVVNSAQAREGEAETAKVRLAVGRQPEPVVKEIPIAPGGAAVVDLTARVNRAVQTFVEARLDGSDPLPVDDTFHLPLSVADMLRVLVVDGAGQEEEAAAGSAGLPGPVAARPETTASETGLKVLSGARILRFALNPGRELGQAQGTGIAVTSVTPDALAGQPLSKYALIVLYDVNSLAESVLKDIDGFVRQGGGLLIVCSGDCKPMKFNRCFTSAGAEHGALCPAHIGNEVELDPPAGISMAGAFGHPVMSAFRDRLQGDLSVVRFTRVRDVSDVAQGAVVVFQDTAGRPLGIEMAHERGRIGLLTFGLELDRGNVARTRAFPVLLWRMVEHLTGRLEGGPPDVLTALRPAVLAVPEPAFAFVQELELAPVLSQGNEASSADAAGPRPASPQRLPISKDRTVLVPGLPVGQYQLRKPTPEGEPAPVVSYTRFVSVNPDPRESDMTRIENQDLAGLLGEQTRIVDAAKGADIAPRGAELWRTLAVFLAVAYLAEGCVGWLLSARREKQRSAGVVS